MRSLRVLVPVVLWVLLTAASPSPSPTVATTPSQSPTAAATPTPSPTPSPSPIPNNAFISLDTSAGDSNTQITVNGGAFLPNEQMTLYWDQPNKIAGGANADSSGNFITKVKPFPGDQPGVHKLCASVPPNPCANFSLNAPQTTPSPSPTPSESPSPSPEASPAQTSTPTPTPIATTLSGFDVISKPPFVFLPIIGVVAILISLGYWILSIVRKPPPAVIPSAAVMHRATRPDYSAPFGTPPTVAPPAAPEPSAWPEPPPPAPIPQPPAAAPEPPASAWETGGEPSAWEPGPTDWGYPELAAPEEPPELPEHGDQPEPGR